MVTMMAAGGVNSLPLRHDRHLHAALRSLDAQSGPVADGIWNRFGGRRSWHPDPGVGLRASGVTSAVWGAVGAGWLQVHEDGPRTHYLLTSDGTAQGHRTLMAMPPGESAYLHAAGAEWALASTSRKNDASAFSSPSSTRRASTA